MLNTKDFILINRERQNLIIINSYIFNSLGRMFGLTNQELKNNIWQIFLWGSIGITMSGLFYISYKKNKKIFSKSFLYESN